MDKKDVIHHLQKKNPHISSEIKKDSIRFNDYPICYSSLVKIVVDQTLIRVKLVIVQKKNNINLNQHRYL
jgi:hypothetical protein